MKYNNFDIKSNKQLSSLIYIILQLYQKQHIDVI